MARPEAEHPLAGHMVEEVEIPYSGEAGTRVEPLAIPLSQELAMVRSSAGPSSGLGGPVTWCGPAPVTQGRPSLSYAMGRRQRSSTSWRRATVDGV